MPNGFGVFSDRSDVARNGQGSKTGGVSPRFWSFPPRTGPSCPGFAGIADLTKKHDFSAQRNIAVTDALRLSSHRCVEGVSDIFYRPLRPVPDVVLTRRFAAKEICVHVLGADKRRHAISKKSWKTHVPPLNAASAASEGDRGLRPLLGLPVCRRLRNEAARATPGLSFSGLALRRSLPNSES